MREENANNMTSHCVAKGLYDIKKRLSLYS